MFSGIAGETADKATAYYAVTANDSSDIYCADTGGHHGKIITLESNSPTLGLFWYGAKGQLVSIAKTGDFCIHGEEEEGSGWTRVVKMKIGGGAGADGPALMVAWVGSHTLASVSGRDDVVRMYDLETEDNYILRLGMSQAPNRLEARLCHCPILTELPHLCTQLSEEDQTAAYRKTLICVWLADEASQSEVQASVSTLSWSASANLLSAGTSTGTVTIWKLDRGNTITKPSSISHLDADPSMQWLPQRGLTMAGCVDSVAWGHDDRFARRLTVCVLCLPPQLVLELSL